MENEDDFWAEKGVLFRVLSIPVLILTRLYTSCNPVSVPLIELRYDGEESVPK